MIKRYRIYGIVQGVGFRPFIKKLADSYEIKGTVCNYGPFVEVVAEGDESVLDAFRTDIASKAPERAAIIKIEEEYVSGNINETGNHDVIKFYKISADTGIGSKKEKAGIIVSKPESKNKFDEFTIIESEKTDGDIFIPPDLAICDECKRELLDPADRRFHHPFINCTQCGPRLTIIENLPYDRERTGMKMFPMCKKCEAEYTDRLSRRMDAQPVCCNECGPEYFILERTGDLYGTAIQKGSHLIEKSGIDPIKRATEILKNGGIVAVKGIGGFHLVCNAKDDAAVKTLRERKQRPVKPFAVMMKDIETVKRYCLISDAKERMLCGPAAPIVLLEKKEALLADEHREELTANGNTGSYNDYLCEETAPGNPSLGVMLPYAPIQLLLFEFSGLDCLVMTSGNISGSPICSTDEEALDVLSGFADCILSNNRPILTRADDSVMDFLEDRPYMIRRSRGFAPLPVRVKTVADKNNISDIDKALTDDSDPDNCNAGGIGETKSNRDEKINKTVLALGGELKNTFCIGRGELFYPSSYIGDLSDIRAAEVLEETIYRFEDMLQIESHRPDTIVCDMHPDYQSVKLAEKLAAKSGARLVKVQHHYAHILSCMAENGHMDKVIGISFDGTGYGEDGSIWGGEIMLCDINGYERVSHITPFMHIGGDTASKEGWRIAVSMLWDIYGHDAELLNDSLEDIFEKCIASDALSENELLMQVRMVENGIGAVCSTSAGRLFDAVSAVLGICYRSTFEGEAAMALEFAAERYADRDKALSEYTDFIEKHGLNDHSFKNGEQIANAASLSNQSAGGSDSASGSFSENICTAGIFKDICSGFKAGLSKDMLAYAFHDMLSEETAGVAADASGKYGINDAALTGGCFQNRLFTKLLKGKLEKRGMTVLTHSMIPANDGGLSLGQAVFASGLNPESLSVVSGSV